MESSTVVAVDDLVVDDKPGRRAAVRAVDHVTLALHCGQALGVAGEPTRRLIAAAATLERVLA